MLSNTVMVLISHKENSLIVPETISHAAIGSHVVVARRNSTNNLLGNFHPLGSTLILKNGFSLSVTPLFLIHWLLIGSCR